MFKKIIIIGGGIAGLTLANFLKKNKKLILYQKKLQRNYGWKSSIEKDIKYLRTNS